MSPQPAGVQNDFPLARLTTVRTGGNADFFARPGNEGELLARPGLGRGRGPCPRRDWLGLEPARCRLGFPRARAQARPRARRNRARGGGDCLRRWRPLSLGLGEGRRLGSRRDRIRRQHPRHGRGGGEDERQCLRRPARRGAGVGRRLHGDGSRTPPAGLARLRLPQLQPDRRRGRLARVLQPAPRRPGGDPRPPGGDAGQAPRGPALWDQDLRLDLQEPRGPAGGGAQRRPAARGCRLPRPPPGRSPFRREARQFRREHRGTRRPPTCWR